MYIEKIKAASVMMGRDIQRDFYPPDIITAVAV